jgi:ElaB/YqjD/DUF883 family membrane-anchored ribosome-binding protein
MNTRLNPSSGPIGREFDALARSAADRADNALDATHSALNSLQDGVENLRDKAPGAIGRAAARLDDLQRRGVDAARKVGTKVQDQAVKTGERTVGYIKDEPMKSVLIAAAAGAALAALIGMASRRHSTYR